MGCKCNVGCCERSIRVLVGAVLVTLAYTHQAGTWAWLGVIPLATGLLRYCPLYSLLNRSTCCGSGCCQNKDGGTCCN